MHSTHSYDGKVSLRDLKKELQAADVQFACMTEHSDTLSIESAAAFVAECRALSDEQFVFVPGFEVPYKDAHILMIGATDFVSQCADAAQLAAWRQVAPLVILAHPVRNHFVVDETMEAVLDGVEIWNQQYEGKRAPRPHSYKLLESLRTRRPGLLATGGLDYHRLEHLTYPRVSIELESLTEAAIISTLKNGAFTFGSATRLVSATGVYPEIHSFSVLAASTFSIFVITVGKQINKTLKSLGLSLPKQLRAAIRSRV